MGNVETVEIRDSQKQIGDVLENGYTIIMTDGKKVLAHREPKEEFATWIFSPNGYTVFGHYFSYWYKAKKDEAFNQAIKDYNER